MLPDEINSAAHISELLRVLRRYADSGTGRKLASALTDMANSGRDGLVAWEPGSEARHVEAVLAVIHQKLALIVLDLYLEIGSARVEAAKWADGLTTPEEFGDSSW